LILNQLMLPDTQDPDLTFTYDVDGAGKDRNQLGAVIASLQSAGGNTFQQSVDDALAAGDVVQLLQVTSSDPELANDSQVAVSGWVGTAPPGATGATLFSGRAKVSVQVDLEPDQHLMTGAIASSRLSTGHLPPAAFPLYLPLPGQKPVLMTVYGAHV